MGKPVFLIENILSTRQFPGHELSASSEAANGQAWRVATGRRSASDRWAPAELDTVAWLRVDCDAPRSVDMIALDRSHNLTGRQLLIQASDDDFDADIRTVVDQVVPLASAAGSALSAGALTTEGAFLQSVASIEALSFRLYVAALGADVRPEIMGLWLGRRWEPAEYFDLPFADASVDVRFAPITTPAGWMGSGRRAAPRTGEIGLKLRSPAEYVSAEYHIEHHYWIRGRPMWIVFDAEAAERGVLARAPEGRYGFEQREGWFQRQAAIAWTEHEPA